MAQFISGLILFFGMHLISVFALPLRDRLAAKSEIGWKLAYGIVSLIGLVLLIRGYGEIRQTATIFYIPPVWLRHVVALLMLPVFILFIAPYFPSRINKVIKHPQLVAVKLWATAHLLVNGSSADWMLFGAFLIWAVMVRISLKRRPVRTVPHVPESGMNTVLVIIAGLVLYVIFAMWLHVPLIGVRPF
ncbi:MAG: NnrU family protein [Gammaproteobacteria bacterium]